MDDILDRRCLTIARYMLENRATVRQAAAEHGLSKSAVHKEMRHRLRQLDARMADDMAALLRYNKSVRHLRGGEATRRRYQGLQSTGDGV